MDSSELPIFGLRYDLPIETYHSGPGISNSGLSDLARSPAIYYKLNRDPNRPPRVSKAGQLEGNLAHCATLEPHLFEDIYAIGQEVNRSTKAWKDFVYANPGKIAIQTDQCDVAFAQAKAIHALPDIGPALALGRPEVSAYWIDAKTGVRCRCRPDWVHPVSSNKVILLDVKTCGDASERGFRKQIARKRYHVQDVFYSDGFALAARVEVLAFIFVAVESQWPYAAASYRLGEESRQEGFNEYRRLLDLSAECEQANKWPGFSDSTVTIELPPYELTPQELEISYVV